MKAPSVAHTLPPEPVLITCDVCGKDRNVVVKIEVPPPAGQTGRWYRLHCGQCWKEAGRPEAEIRALDEARVRALRSRE